MTTTLIVTELITLDGVVDSPGGGTHPHAGWTFKDVPHDDAAYEIKGREQDEAGAMLLGRVSYEEFAPVWPSMPEFEVYNAMPKYVVSSRLTDPAWNRTEVLGSLEDVRAIKESGTVDGTLLLHASPTLAQGLAAAGLVDRYHLLVFPVLLGIGKRLFDPATAVHRRLLLREQAAYANGVTLQVLDVEH